MTIKENNESVNEVKSEFFLIRSAKWLIEATKRTFKGHSRNNWIWISIFLIISILSGIILLMSLEDDTWLFEIVVKWFIVPILEWGPIGIILFIVFMGIQGILVPIPSELVLLSSGMIWGLFGGTLIGMIGSMAAGILTYYIAVMGGRPLVEKFLGDDLEVIDGYIDKYGSVTIILARAFPFMAFDPISYASGFLKIKFRVYIIATFIGSIIRTFFYAWLGSTLTKGDIQKYIDDPVLMEEFINSGAGNFNFMLTIIILVLGAAFLGYQFLLLPYLKKKHKQEKMAELSANADQ